MNRGKRAPSGGGRKKKINFFLLAVLLVFAVPGAVFFFRAPALVVTDLSFYQLYGLSRLRFRQFTASLELWRRVIPVPAAESAGDDLVILAVEAVSRSALTRAPFAVLFPPRYIEAASLYRESHPGTRVLVMEGKNPAPASAPAPEEVSAPEQSAVRFAGTDTAADLYRAGLCAAFLAGEGKNAVFFFDGVLQTEYREAFRSGFQARGSGLEPVFVNAASDYSSFAETGCVVVAGPASGYLEKNLELPVILFSWADPALCPRAVKIVFDDSPWALAADALRALSSAENSAGPPAPERAPSPAEKILLPSEAAVLADRIEEKKDFRLIQDLIKENFEEK